MTIDTRETSFRRFLIAFLLIMTAVFGPIWLWVVFEPLDYLNRDYPMWLAKMEMVDKGEVGTLAVVGDSAPMAALIPARIGPGVVNLSLGGATSVDTFYLARKIVAAPSPPKAVIISITPYDFTQSDFFWTFSVGFNSLSLQEINEVRQRSRALQDNSLFGVESPGDVDARLKMFLYAVKFPPFSFPALVNGHFNQRYDVNLKSLNLVLANRGQSYFGLLQGTTEPDREVGLKSFVPTKIMDDYFDRTLALFQSRKIPVYYLGMPYNAASVQLYWPGLKDAFANYLNRYTTRYPGFHILGDLFTTYPSEDFGDPWHLNEAGAPPWSDHVARLLSDAHVEGGPFVVQLR